MQHSYHFLYKRLKFGPLLETNIEKMRSLRNTNKECFVFNQEISVEQQKTWYKNYLLSENDIMFSLYSQEGIWLGVAGIYEIDQIRKSAEFGRLMLERSVTKEKGLGVDAVEGLFYFSTKILGLKRLYLEVFSDNIAALKTYQRAGFTETGEEKVLKDKKILISMQHVVG